MIRLEYQNYDHLVEIAQEYIEKHNANLMTVVCSGYLSAKHITSELVRYGYDLAFAELEDPEWDNYEKEFYVQIWDGEISVEKAYKYDKYYHLEGELVFFMEECDPEIKSLAKDCTVITVAEADECNCNGDCVECDHYEEENNYSSISYQKDDTGVHSVSEVRNNGMNASYKSYYSDTTLSDAQIKKVLKLFSELH